MPAVRRATIPVRKNHTTCTSRLNLDHVRPPRDHSQVVFDRDGGGAGIWPAVCRPTRHHDGHPAAIAHWFSTRMVGADMFPDVCCHVRRRTWHTLRVPRTWHAWRGWSMRYTWRTWSTWRIWRARRAWHAWAPASRTWGRFGFPVAVHPKTAAEHAEARVLLMCWEGGWE